MKLVFLLVAVSLLSFLGSCGQRDSSVQQLDEEEAEQVLADDESVENFPAPQVSNKTMAGLTFVDEPNLSGEIEAVREKLRFGGQYYQEGMLGDTHKEILQWIDEVMIGPIIAGVELGREKNGDLPIINQFSVSELFDQLGLDSTVAYGRSVHQLPDGRYESRSATYLRGKHRGFFALMGEEPRPVLAAQLVSKNVDFVAEATLDLRHVPSLIRYLSRMLGGDERWEIIDWLEQGLGRATLEEVLSEQNSRIIWAIEVHPDQKLPSSDHQLSVFDVMIWIDGAGGLIEDMEGMSAANHRLELPGGLKGWTYAGEGEDLDGMDMAVAIDRENDRFALSLRSSYLIETLEGEKLSESPVYQSSIQGMPEKVNAFWYFSEGASAKIINAIEPYFDQMAKALDEKDSEDMERVVEPLRRHSTKLRETLSGLSKGVWVGVSVLEDHVYSTQTRLPFSTRPLTPSGLRWQPSFAGWAPLAMFLFIEEGVITEDGEIIEE